MSFVWSSFGGQAFEEAFEAVFPAERRSLQEGQAMIGHDAVLTAVAAIRQAAGNDEPAEGEESPEVQDLPRLEEVPQFLKGLYGPTAVPGSSGFIEIDSTNGHAIDKPIPVVRRQSDGTQRFLELAPSQPG